MDEGKPEPVTPCMFVCGIGFGVSWMWVTFCNNLVFSMNQFPGICVQGRLINQSFNDAVYKVDDTFVDNDAGVVIMRCLVDTLVYPCPVADVNQPCSQASAETQPLHPRSEDLDAGVVCGRDSAMNMPGTRVCRHNDWTCEAGNKCDAYEKTARLCASEFIAKEPYSCWYLPGKPHAGVHRERAPFPFLWLLGCLLTCACAIPATLFAAWLFALAYEEAGRNMVQLLKTFCCIAGIFICIGLSICGLGLMINNMAGAKTAKGPLSFRVNDTSMVDNFGITYANERPPRNAFETGEWKWMVLIGLVTFCLMTVVPCVCVLGCTLCENRNGARKQRVGLVESSGSSDSD